MLVRPIRQFPEPAMPQAAIRKAGEPIAFAGCAGFLHQAPGPIGILMLSPWGFEEFTIRKSWRILAEMLAEAGFPCLRFDLPGTGDSLGRSTDILSLETWRDAIRTAAQELRRSGHVEHIAVIGQGLGAVLAQDMAELIEAEALVVLAPMAEGRAGVRELALWGSMIASIHNFPVETGADQALNVAGFALSPSLADQLKQLKWQRNSSKLKSAFVVARPNRASDIAMAEILDQRGIDVSRSDFIGYDELVSDPTMSRTPLATFENICAWLASRLPASRFPDRARTRLSPASFSLAIVSDIGFEEEAICFGPEERLFGVLCTPAGLDHAPVVVLPNSGYNPHIGWARGHVHLARKLALAGIASFRIDGANVGDGGADPDGPAEVLYSSGQIDEISLALDVLAARGLGPMIIAGRCSGAFVALHAAEQDARIAGIVTVNPLRLIWNPRETVEQAMKDGSRSLENYRQRLFSREMLLRVVTFKLPVWRVGRSVLLKLNRRLSVKLAEIVGDLTLMGRLYRQVNTRFRDFHRQGIQVALVYADGDGGLDELATYCGPHGRSLANLENISVTIVPDADHDMTPPHAQAEVYRQIVGVLERIVTLR